MCPFKSFKWMNIEEKKLQKFRKYIYPCIDDQNMSWHNLYGQIRLQYFQNVPFGKILRRKNMLGYDKHEDQQEKILLEINSFLVWDEF